jgi:uncharacterized protein YecE (DUF72 family)
VEEIRPIVGCCGWSEAQARYFADFPSIELQTTFYQPPAVAVARRWKAKAPPGFVFCIKAWQLITHTASSPTYRRLKSGISPKEHDLYGSFRPTEQVWLAWERTREIAEALDARVIVFQCPKSFLPTRENIRNLTTFFHEIHAAGPPDGSLLAWEPRGEDWKPALIRELCAANRFIHCVDPFVNDSVSGEALYWRLHGKGGYRYRYTDADLAELECKLRSRRGLRGPNYVMFNNIYSRDDAARFLTRTSPGI